MTIYACPECKRRLHQEVAVHSAKLAAGWHCEGVPLARPVPLLGLLKRRPLPVDRESWASRNAAVAGGTVEVCHWLGQCLF